MRHATYEVEQKLLNSSEPISSEKKEILEKLRRSLWSHQSSSGFSGLTEQNLKTKKYLSEVKKTASKSPFISSLIRKKDLVVSRFFNKTKEPPAPKAVPPLRGSNPDEIEGLDEAFVLNNPEFEIVFDTMQKRNIYYATLDRNYSKSFEDLNSNLVSNYVKLDEFRESSVDIGQFGKGLPSRFDYQGDNEDKFIYSFLDGRIRNDTLNKIFENAEEPDYFYIFTQNNKQVNSDDIQNSFLAEVTLTRVPKEAYLTPNDGTMPFDHFLTSQP
mmetsp:Transcript_41872/g.64087  ORF Transcript_41872/g.64087 Transcript_41872/m.64087 type:complete len:271 (+) Transcript_41872:265-1077(+)